MNEPLLRRSRLNATLSWMTHLVSSARGLLPAVFLALTVVSLATACTNSAEPGSTSAIPPPGSSSAVLHYTYEIINIYPHDEQAFTQGLAFENGFLYEGTGLRGNSSLRKVELETGEVLQSVLLPDRYFGEGIAVLQDRILQLTWQSRIGFVYSKKDFNLIGDFTYDTEGWGLAYDGTRLIISDGTSTLHFLDPETFKKNGYLEVHDAGTPLTRLNELEFINGHIFANVWQTDAIAIVNPEDGRVEGWLDLSGLLESQPLTGSVDVLNGIAHDAANDRLFVTGKLWPWLFEIRLLPA